MKEIDEDKFAELVDRVCKLTGLGGRASFHVADALYDDGEPTSAQIVDKAIELGYDVERKHDAPAERDMPLPEITFNPIEVLAEMYRVAPRVLVNEFPRVGRTPKESVFYDQAIQDAINQLPEQLRVLIADVDLFNGAITVKLYDEANDLDRAIGPINLDRYDSAQAVHEAILTLIKRLPRVLRSDYN